MTRRAWMPVITAAAFALAVPTYAQDKGQAGARPNTGGGGGGGSAVSRPSGGGGSSSGGGSTSSSSPSSGGSSSASRPSGGDGGDRGGYRPSAPERRSGPSAVPRSGSSDRSSGEGRRAGSNGTSAASSLSSDDNGGQRRAVPTYSRPRDGRPVIGTAVGRTGVYPPIYGGGGGYYPYSRYGYYYNHYPYGYFWPSYGFGVGYFYDPWMWGYAPYSFYGYGGGYGGGYYGSTYGNGRQYRDVGGVRLKVRPVDGQVYVDGYYVGEVDNFDGMFQKLTLESGAHRIEIRAEGFLPEQFEVMVVPGETITYKGDLKLAGRK